MRGRVYASVFTNAAAVVVVGGVDVVAFTRASTNARFGRWKTQRSATRGWWWLGGGGYAKFVALFEIMIIWLVGWAKERKKEGKVFSPASFFSSLVEVGLGGKAAEEEYACVFVCAELRSLAFLVE